MQRAVAVGVVVQPRPFGADPEQVAPAPGEDVDRVVDQLAAAGGDLRGVAGAEPFAGMELLDAEDALAFGADPERSFVVAMDGPDGLREVAGQHREGDRAERVCVARALVEPLPVGADPDDLLSAVAQQREDAAVDVDVFGDELLALFGGGAQTDDAIDLKRDDVVVAVADDARHAAHLGNLVVHLLEINRLTSVREEFVERSSVVYVVDAAAVGEGILGKTGCRDPFGSPETKGTVARGKVGRDAEDALAGEQPEVVFRIEMQSE